jgi:hypothetical protein
MAETALGVEVQFTDGTVHEPEIEVYLPFCAT